MRKRDIFSVYFRGLAELAFVSLGFAIAGLLCLQLLAILIAMRINPEAALLFVWQSLILLALWPGQRFWTIRRTTAHGFEHSIIGVPSDDDLRLRNHRAARRAGSERQG
ncbi:MAG: hypothetical protein AAF999_12725 [Pseudomonadota bacterium]